LKPYFIDGARACGTSRYDLCGYHRPSTHEVVLDLADAILGQAVAGVQDAKSKVGDEARSRAMVKAGETRAKAKSKGKKIKAYVEEHEALEINPLDPANFADEIFTRETVDEIYTAALEYGNVQFGATMTLVA